MNKTHLEAESYLRAYHAEALPADIITVLCPPYTALMTVGGFLATQSWSSIVMLGAQNCAGAVAGAYTGEVSCAMLVALECGYVLIGHSERRSMYAESDEQIAVKVKLALQHELKPVLCIGETEHQRDAGETEAVLQRQLQAALPEEMPAVADLVIAYEPVWAIGTGRTAEVAQVSEAMLFIRQLLIQKYGNAAEEISLLYGGSVNTGNISELATCGIDGALVGGASLDPVVFADLTRRFSVAKGLR